MPGFPLLGLKYMADNCELAFFFLELFSELAFEYKDLSVINNLE